MVKRVLTLQDLGPEGAWLLMQQANGIPDALAKSSFMDGRTALLMFKKESLAERLCVTAAVRQMSGQVVYVGRGDWVEDLSRCPVELSPIYDYYVDCTYIMGIDAASTQRSEKYLTRIPTINLGNAEACPPRALADLACMLRFTNGDLSKAQVAWLGAPNGTLYSLLEAAAYFPFSLRIALPRKAAINHYMVEQARKEGAKVRIVESKEEALEHCNFICVGDNNGVCSAEDWRIDGALLERAPEAYMLLCSHVVRDSLPVLPEILEGPRTLLLLQAENRLRVHKRLLHWVLEDE
ncbi:MAG: ornithine carbamoyltransferase [Desulfovibrionaceae bacterium]|nr:ornithine carbamoyltransferase [Desulfovibrionaceae bacterium]